MDCNCDEEDEENENVETAMMRMMIIRMIESSVMMLCGLNDGDAHWAIAEEVAKLSDGAAPLTSEGLSNDLYFEIRMLYFYFALCICILYFVAIAD